MTHQQAVDVLVKERTCVQRVGCSDKLCDRERECTKCDLAMSSNDIIEAFNMAICAIKTQIPQKPIVEEQNYKDYPNLHSFIYFCPTCFKKLIHKDETGWFSGRRVRHCECGQALDWNES